jgi:hypothetical protein
MDGNNCNIKIFEIQSDELRFYTTDGISFIYCTHLEEACHPQSEDYGPGSFSGIEKIRRGSLVELTNVTVHCQLY